MVSEIESAVVVTLKRFFDQIDLMSLEEQVRLHLMLNEYNRILAKYINDQQQAHGRKHARKVP